jgi:hypothetical protein
MNELETLSSQPELLAIRDKHKIDEERFVRGVIFAEYIVNGESANKAYTYAFECDMATARTRSANLRNSRWIQELILYFKPDENTLYFGEIRQIIRKGMEIIDNPMSEPKDVVAAMNALAKYVKVSKSVKDNEDTSISDATKLISGLMEGIAQLSNQDKMIGPNGKIIDVPILE